MSKPKHAKPDGKPDLLMVVAHAVERLTRLHDKELHAEIVEALAAVEGEADAADPK